MSYHTIEIEVADGGPLDVDKLRTELACHGLRLRRHSEGSHLLARSVAARALESIANAMAIAFERHDPDEVPPDAWVLLRTRVDSDSRDVAHARHELRVQQLIAVVRRENPQATLYRQDFEPDALVVANRRTVSEQVAIRLCEHDWLTAIPMEEA